MVRCGSEHVTGWSRPHSGSHVTAPGYFLPPSEARWGVHGGNRCSEKRSGSPGATQLASGRAGIQTHFCLETKPCPSALVLVPAASFQVSLVLRIKQRTPPLLGHTGLEGGGKCPMPMRVTGGCSWLLTQEAGYPGQAGRRCQHSQPPWVLVLEGRAAGTCLVSAWETGKHHTGLPFSRCPGIRWGREDEIHQPGKGSVHWPRRSLWVERHPCTGC